MADSQAKKPKANGRKKGSGPVNYSPIRDEYISDASTSYRSLAEKYGVNLKALQAHATADAWPDTRQKLSEKAYEDFQQKLLDEKSTIQVEQLANYADMSKLVMQTARSMIDKGSQLKNKQGDVVFDPDTDQPLYEQVDAFQLEKLARALDIAEKGRRVVLGLPTAVNGVSSADGGSVWQGLSDLAEEAKKVIDAAGQSSAS